MKPDFWHQRWQLGQIGFHQQEINSHLQKFFHRLPVPGTGQIFVPLCGKSLDLLWLRAQGHQVLGVEISPVAVEDFFRENRLTPSVTRQGRFERYEVDGLAILNGDFFNLKGDELQQICAVYDRASLVALPEEMRIDYASHFNAILPAGISCLLISMEYPQQEMDGPPFAVAESEVRQLFGNRFDVSHLLTLDILAENPQFARRGLSTLQEKVFLLSDIQERRPS